MKSKNMQLRFYFVLLLLSTLPLFALGLSNHGVWTADEPRVAEIGREMAACGNWAVPTLNKKPFLEEPPLYYASIATVFRVFGGPSDKTVRIPSAVFALGAVLALFFLGTTLFDPRTGFLAGFVMATCGEYFRVAHWVIVDSALTCFIVLSLAFFMKGYLSKDWGRRILSYGLCYVSCALAFYSKGFIGVVIPALAVFVFLGFDKNLREVFRMHLWLGIGIFLILTLPWFLALWQQGGSEFLNVFFVHNHLERFAGGSTGHVKPFYYYLTQFPGAYLPWTLLLVPAFYWSFRRAEHADDRTRKGVLFAKCWFIAGFVFLSMASTKRVLYLMPIFAPISLLVAHYIEASFTRASFRRFEGFFAVAFAAAALAVGLAVVPAFFYASGKYGFGFPPAETVSTVLLALAATVLALAALVNYRTSKERFWSFSGASVLALLFLGLVAAMPLLDRYKSFVPFCDAVSSAARSAPDVYAYQPDETLRGAVPFYTGRFIREVDTLPALEETVRKEKTAFVVIRDKRQRLEKELLATGKFSVVARQDMDNTRSLVLFKAVSGQGRMTGGK